MKRRSLGVTIFGILFILLGAQMVLLPIQLLFRRSVVGEEVSIWISTIVAGVGMSSYLLLTGIGLLTLRNWGRWLAVICAVLSALQVIGTIFVHPTLERHLRVVVNSLVMLGVDGLIVWYFLRPGVKAQFQRKDA